MRLARRELRRRPARTVLVLLLVFLPTAAMAAVVTGIRTSDRSLAGEIVSVWGRADGGAILGPSPEELSQLRSSLPVGSRVLVEHRVQDRVRMGDRRTYVEVNDVQLDDPTAEGRFGSLNGRLPQASGEAVLSTDAARAIGVDVGDAFTPDRLGTRLTVVGIIVVRAGHDNIVYAPGPSSGGAETRVAVDLPEGAENIDGSTPPSDGSATLAPVSSFFGPEKNKTVNVFWSYVGGGVGLVVLGTVITAAFAVGARQQLRSVGLLSSSGASPSTVKWFLVAQGAVAGLVGSIVGVASGVLATQLIPAHVVDGLAGRPIEGVTVPLTDLVPIVVIGTLAASIAAWLPARSAARVATLQALAGRRPLPKVPRRLPVLGALSVGGGCALLAMAVAGSRGGGSSLWSLVAIRSLGGVARRNRHRTLGDRRARTRERRPAPLVAAGGTEPGPQPGAIERRSGSGLRRHGHTDRRRHPLQQPQRAVEGIGPLPAQRPGGHRDLPRQPGSEPDWGLVTARASCGQATTRSHHPRGPHRPSDRAGARRVGAWGWDDRRPGREPARDVCAVST